MTGIPLFSLGTLLAPVALVGAAVWVVFTAARRGARRGYAEGRAEAWSNRQA